VRTVEAPMEGAEGTTVHLTTIMRQSLPRRGAPRRQPSRSS
jgi:hypothetical protein